MLGGRRPHFVFSLCIENNLRTLPDTPPRWCRQTQFALRWSLLLRGPRPLLRRVYLVERFKLTTVFPFTMDRVTLYGAYMFCRFTCNRINRQQKCSTEVNAYNSKSTIYFKWCWWGGEEFFFFFEVVTLYVLCQFPSLKRALQKGSRWPPRRCRPRAGF